jgi:uncharacterized protein YgiB involved in biofilm formation
MSAQTARLLGTLMPGTRMTVPSKPMINSRAATTTVISRGGFV